MRHYLSNFVIFIVVMTFSGTSSAWYDETHIAVAKVAGYGKWYNAAGADMVKIKALEIEKSNHYANNPPGTVVTPAMVLEQVGKYNQPDNKGHLYGSIIASIRDYIENKRKDKYREYHMAFCAHYVGDLSQPFHNTAYNSFNKKYHKDSEAFINKDILSRLDKIKIYAISIESEKDLADEIARIANISIKLGYKLEAEKRLPTEAEAYVQLGHSASLLKAILQYVRKPINP